jgi:hypothetical protein
MYLAIPHDWTPDVPENPDKDDVRAAVKVLARVHRGYRFADIHSAAGVLSGVLAAVVRPVLGLCPAYAANAHVYGAGKTKFACALGAIVEGRIPAVSAYAASSDSNETRKKIMADALGGARFTCLDNISGYLDDSALATALTSGWISDRKLMVMEGAQARVRALMTLTGANMSLSAELQRRVVMINIDAGDRPTKNVYDHDPVREGLAHRFEIAVAACTVLRAYFLAGAPCIVRDDAGGFTDWDRLCRQPVLWLIQKGLTNELPWSFVDPDKPQELADPAHSMLDDPVALDPATTANYTLLQALVDVFGEVDEGIFTSAEVAAKCEQGVISCPTTALGQLSRAMRDVSGGRDRPTTVTVGKVLAYRVGRPAGGLKLLGLNNGSPVKSWRVVAAADAPGRR